MLYNAQPGSLNGKALYITQYEDDVINAMTETEYNTYMADEDNYTILDWREKANPGSHWAAPFVTGKKYYLRFEFGLDFEYLRVDRVKWLWNSDVDGDLYWVMPFYDVREAIYVDDNNGNRYVNTTIGDAEHAPYREMGDNAVYNETENK